MRDVSVIWTMAHTLVMFLLLFESRYPRKKTVALTVATMVPLGVLNLLLFALLGFERYSTAMLATLSLPSCVFFWFLAKYRDGRFFFTFCVVDTVVLEILYITNILHHYLSPDNYLFMFLIRLISYPLIEWWAYKKLRPIFLTVQKNTKKGWGIFALIGALFYVAITLMMSTPSIITDRPDQLPALIILFILMPVVYADIILTLRNLQKMYDTAEQEDILTLQVSNLTARMEEFSEANEAFRVERHNFRHKLKAIASLVKTEQYEECLHLLSEYEESLDKTKVRRFCPHTVLDAVLAAYVLRAEREGIRLDLGFAFPEVLPTNEAELATVIANAFENAIHACQKVAPAERFIEIKVVSRPRLMVRIANSYGEAPVFDEEGIPVNRERDHGFGTRSIVTFCNKNNGFYEFQAKDGVFSLYLNF